MPALRKPLHAPLPPRLEDGEAGPSLAGIGRGALISDARVTGEDLANLEAPELSLRRAELVRARLTGVQWTRGTIGDAVFRECRVDLAAFAGTTFERVLFEDCVLTQADFREALLRSVRLERCDLTEADLGGLRIDRVELRGCTLDGVHGLERLRGAAMPWGDIVANAAQFAGALGIRVLED
jgi:uncharacterized protein YjbI with pentapeptide repeats